MPKGKRKNKINLFQEIIINNKVAKNKKHSKIIGINNFLKKIRRKITCM